jgi:undecaprenyl-phosphate 4-deoxy-4-formamido-L-arabinose transferase
MGRAEMNLSIIIPVYNSERLVTELTRRIAHAMSVERAVATYEVILVNDCSRDASWQMIERACELYPGMRGVNLRANAGQHNAIMAGLRAASGAVIVVMDDDLQHAPEDIGKLYARVLEGCDVCYAAFSKPKHAAWKRLGSSFRDATARALLGVPRGVRISSFKAMTADIAREITRYEGPFPYVDGLALMATRDVANVELEHHSRADGRGNYGLRESVFLWTKVAMNFSVVPLRLASWLGFAFAALGFLFAVFLIFQQLAFNRIPVPGWASLVVVILILGGIQLLALGAIGEYLGRAYLHLNGKPQYVVKSKKGFGAGGSR